MLMIFRNLLMGLVVFFLVYLSFLSRSEWVPMHAWNRAFADVFFATCFDLNNRTVK